MTTRANDEAISGGRSPPSNQTSNINPGQSSSTTHQTISTQGINESLMEEKKERMVEADRYRQTDEKICAKSDMPSYPVPQNIYKYPQASKPMGAGPGIGTSGVGTGGSVQTAFLQKRLAKGQKYFDSGDYQMAKQNPRPGVPGRMMIPILAQPPTGHTIPRPDTVPARKTSIIQPLHDHSQSMHQAADPAHAGISSLLPPPVTPGQPMPNPAITKLAL
jgi:hypothetical protein